MFHRVVVLGSVLLFPVQAQSHDIYTGLTNSSGSPCCSEHDCRPAHYRINASGVQMSVEGRWITVPPSIIQYRTLPGDNGETAGGHWCGYNEELPDFRAEVFGYCAVLPPSFAEHKH